MSICAPDGKLAGRCWLLVNTLDQPTLAAVACRAQSTSSELNDSRTSDSLWWLLRAMCKCASVQVCMSICAADGTVAGRCWLFVNTLDGAWLPLPGGL